MSRPLPPSFRSFVGSRLYWIIAAVLCAVAPEARSADAWLRARSTHFEMFSSASERESRKILTALEQFRASFLTAIPLRQAAEPRVTVVLFGRDREFRDYKPLYKGKPKDVAGYFIGGEDEVMIALTTDLSGTTDPTDVIYHEYVHLLLHTRDLRLPLWLNEGLAELYSTFRVVDQEVEFGLAHEPHTAVLQQSAMLPLPRLIAVTKQSPDYNEERRAGIFYAQSWAFTHYLLCGADRTNRAKLGRFFELVGDSNDNPDAAFREAFGKDYGEMERTLRNYLQGGQYYSRRLPLPVADADAKLEVRPATEAERDFALLHLRWRVRQSADTAIRAITLSEKNPDDPRPHELLATLALQEGDELRALEHYRRAADRNTDNPVPYVRLARHALQTFEGGAMRLENRLPKERATELRGWIDRALASAPDHAEALETLATIESLAPEIRPAAINRIQQRVRQMTDPSRTYLALAIVRWRVNDPATAGDIVELVLGARKSDMPTRAVASALRARLPETSVSETEVMTAATASHIRAPAAGPTHSTRAELLLTRILAERGSTAPRDRFEVKVTNVAHDPEAHRRWTEMEAARARATEGDGEAMHQLALAHATGFGAEFSPDLAAEWVEKAASSGQVAAVNIAMRALGQVELTCRLLRETQTLVAPENLPPLDAELVARIAASKPAKNTKFTALYRPEPRLPETVTGGEASADASVFLLIGADGRPQRVRVMQASSSTFADAIERCVKQWRFLPTIRDGEPVGTGVEAVFTFRAEPTAAR